MGSLGAGPPATREKLKRMLLIWHPRRSVLAASDLRPVVSVASSCASTGVSASIGQRARRSPHADASLAAKAAALGTRHRDTFLPFCRTSAQAGRARGGSPRSRRGRVPGRSESLSDSAICAGSGGARPRQQCALRGASPGAGHAGAHRRTSDTEDRAGVPRRCRNPGTPRALGVSLEYRAMFERRAMQATRGPRRAWFARRCGVEAQRWSKCRRDFTTSR